MKKRKHVKMSPFRKLRLEKGISISEVARRLGVSHTAVSKWDNGQGFPKTARLSEVAEVLGGQVGDFF